MLSAEAIIEKYHLAPLDQEGGYFRQVWLSPEKVANEALGDVYPKGGTHPMGTLIHFLLTADSFSAMHRLPTPEHWMYHLGDPVEMLLLHPDGSGETKLLGPDLVAGQEIYVTTPANSWQGSRLFPGAGKHGYFFGSCWMVPGFEWTDFELGACANLCEQYPDFNEAIVARTRTEVLKGER
jgi:Uncharacterized conserved protein